MSAPAFDHIFALWFVFSAVRTSICIIVSVSMASPCLSAVLTHANLTMYQTGLPDVLPQQTSVLSSISPLQISSPAYSPSTGGEQSYF